MPGERSWEHDPKDYENLEFDEVGTLRRFEQAFRHIRQQEGEFHNELPNGETRELLRLCNEIQQALLQAEIIMREPEGDRAGTTASPLQLRQHAFDLADELLQKLRKSLDSRGVDNPEKE